MQVAVSWLRLSVAGISHRTPGNCFRASYVTFVVDQVALEQVFLAVLRSFLVSTVRTVDHMSSVIYHRPYTFDTSLNPLKTKRRLLFFQDTLVFFWSLREKPLTSAIWARSVRHTYRIRYTRYNYSYFK